MLKPIVKSTPDDVAEAAVDAIVDHLERVERPLVCLAAGSTPLDSYRRLAERLRGRPELIRKLRLIKLDEWVGMSADDPDSCERSLRTTLIDRLPDFSLDRYVGFDGAVDPEIECRRIADWLDRNGPITLSILGLGVNGHLGFNEPAESATPHSHRTPLSAESLAHEMVKRRPVRPTFGVTLGMADLIGADETVLLVIGTNKREPLRRLLRGDVTPRFPATFLHLRRDVVLLVDQTAMD
jgi:galactosamine-6-phosphate isomerase